MFVLYAAQTGAADFRVLDFGQPCAAIRNLEEAQGSKEITWSEPSPDTFTFGGIAFDRDVSIVYLCKHGLFAAGHYIFPTQSIDKAVTSLRAVYEGFASIYGKPFLDSSPWQYGAEKKDRRAISSDPRDYYVTWRALGAWTTITLVPADGEPQDTWRVFVVIKQLGQE